MTTVLGSIADDFTGATDLAGLLARRKEGRQQHCSLNPEPLRDAAEWIAFHTQFSEEKLDSLASFVEEKPDEGEG